VSLSRQAAAHTRWRRIGLGLGALVLLWLPFEDSHAWPALLLAALLCGWAAARLVWQAESKPERLLLRSGLAGALAGLLVSPMAFGLMSLKSGLHAHPQPDYLPAQIRAVFSSTPYFVISGLLCGLASALYRLARLEDRGIG
jgi:hypothetical protein